MIRRPWISLSVLMILVGVVLRAGSGESQEPNQQADTSQELIRKVLSAKGDVQWVEVPLSEVVDKLAAKHRLNIILDRHKLAAEGIDPATPITLKLSGISLAAALRLMLDPLGLEAVHHNEVLKITTKSDSPLLTKVYGVREALTADNDGADVDYQLRDKLLDLIRATIVPDSWQTTGGRGSVKPLRSMLVVSQTNTVHEEIERLLADLKAGRRRPADGKPLRMSDAIDKALLGKISLDVTEQPLNESLAALEEKHKIPLLMDRRGMENEGVDPAVPITIKANEVPLQAALNLVLDPLGLTWVKSHEVLLVTPKTRTAATLERRLYDVRDLLQGAADTNEDDLDDSAMIDLLATTVDPASWTNAGGAGVLRSAGGLIVILHDRSHHEQVEQMLRDLRKVRSPAAP